MKKFLFIIGVSSLFLKAYSENLFFLNKNRKEILIAEDRTPLYSEPGRRGNVIATKSILERVRLIKTTNIFINKEEFEEWCLVETYIVFSNENKNEVSKFKALKGWVKGKSLLKEDKIKQVNHIGGMFIVVIIQDESVNRCYRIYTNGTFLEKEDCELPNKFGIKGKIYRYQNIIILRRFLCEKKKYLGEFVFLYLDRQGTLRSQLGEIEVLTNKSDFPPWAQSDVPPVLEGDFAILTGDNVNIRTKPTTNSAVLTRLKKGARVKVLEISDEMFRMGEREGFWVYVETDEKDKQGKLIRGWMVDIYLKPEE